jgi:hypothetical protein
MKEGTQARRHLGSTYDARQKSEGQKRRPARGEGASHLENNEEHERPQDDRLTSPMLRCWATYYWTKYLLKSANLDRDLLGKSTLARVGRG